MLKAFLARRWSALLGVVVIAICCGGAQAAGPTGARSLLAELPDEITPYDAGYVSRAAELCPNVSLVVEFSAETKQAEPYKSGAAMFDANKQSQALESACKAALRLYNAKTGKVAKLLDQPSDAPISVNADGKRKINLSGRQRMLSQYMAKSVCFASLGVDAIVQTNEARLAHNLFAKTLADLRKGSLVQEMLPEADAGILDALAVVDKLWLDYGPAVLNQDLPAVMSQNPMVLVKMNEAVTLFQKKYGAGGDVAPAIAAALNIAGRERMLTQKASKEFCLIASGKDVEQNRANLKATIELFEKSLRGLKDGDPAIGLEPAPSSHIANLIDTASVSWGKIKYVFGPVADGAKPSAEGIASVSRDNVSVMFAANAVVDAFERHKK